MSTLFPRYNGRFYGLIPLYRNGDRVITAETLWEVTVLQKADEPWECADLVLDADTPLLLEWDDVRPEDVIEGSTATLRLISPGDRTFADLYTVDPLGVVLEVKRGDEVVWRGSLEPELYEEPYATADGYTVELSFADFAAMERRDFDRHGVCTFAQILADGAAATAVDFAKSGEPIRGISTEYVDTSTGDASTVSLADLRISADNFYDEDGEPMTLKEAVETVCRPLGLHIRQHGGAMAVYDWNYVASDAAAATAKPGRWHRLRTLAAIVIRPHVKKKRRPRKTHSPGGA